MWKKGNRSLPRHGSCHERLPSPWRSHQENALGDPGADGVEFLGRPEEFHNLLQLLLSLIDAGHIREVYARLVGCDTTSPALAEGKDVPITWLRVALPHKHHHHQPYEQQRQQPEERSEPPHVRLSLDLQIYPGQLLIGHAVVAQRFRQSRVGLLSGLRHGAVGERNLQVIAILYYARDLAGLGIGGHLAEIHLRRGLRLLTLLSRKAGQDKNDQGPHREQEEWPSRGPLPFTPVAQTNLPFLHPPQDRYTHSIMYAPQGTVRLREGIWQLLGRAPSNRIPSGYSP